MMASLGRKVHTAGNTIRYLIDYSEWLEEGETLKTPCTIAIAAQTPAITDATISGVSILPSVTELVFLLAGGSANEVFTVNVVATNSRNETKNDTIEFFVAAP